MSETKKTTRKTILQVPIGALKARLSEYVARARAGEEVTITDRGRPVAKLAPLSGRAAMEGREAALVRGGLARAPTRKLDSSWMTAPRPLDPEGRSLETILEERAEDW